MTSTRKHESESRTTETNNSPKPAPRKPNWAKISFIANIVLVAGFVFALAGAEIIHQSNTNPDLCGLCHIMRPNIESYLTGPNLDHVHAQANVQCKDCHDYPIPAEIEGAIKYVAGSYYVTEEGVLPKLTFADEMCTQCHISKEHVAASTDFLYRNPHDAPGMGEYTCNNCHISHGEQIDVCGECHDNGGQRMVGEPAVPRGMIGSPY